MLTLKSQETKMRGDAFPLPSGKSLHADPLSPGASKKQNLRGPFSCVLTFPQPEEEAKIANTLEFQSIHLLSTKNSLTLSLYCTKPP
jgi:hypothetical protein